MGNTLIRNLSWALMLLLLVLLAPGCASQQAFATPELAVETLVSALQNGNQQEIKQILGWSGDQLLQSGDPISDRNAIDRFLDSYRERHQLVHQPDGDVTLIVGNNDWPMPVPLVMDEKKKGWIFDVAAGKDEIINRRVGRNELDAIQTLLAIVDAQREYAQIDPQHFGAPAYAPKFFSDPGKRNGLYWPTLEGEPASPLGQLVAQAQSQGYSRNGSGKPQPYRGYKFRMLTSQGPHAEGGPLDYTIGGMMIWGFAVVAYPAEYGKSGVMTFTVNQRGVVYQRDLDSATELAASSMTTFDPGPGWELADVTLKP